MRVLPVAVGAFIGAAFMAPIVGPVCAAYGAVGAIAIWLLACWLVP